MKKLVGLIIALGTMHMVQAEIYITRFENKLPDNWKAFFKVDRTELSHKNEFAGQPRYSTEFEITNIAKKPEGTYVRGNDLMVPWNSKGQFAYLRIRKPDGNDVVYKLQDYANKLTVYDVNDEIVSDSQGHHLSSFGLELQPDGTPRVYHAVN